MRHWASGFVGLPYADKGRSRAGADCWGTCRLVYAEVLGIDVPSYIEMYSSCDVMAEVDSVVARATTSPLWRLVEKPAEFDILLFRTGRYATHAGVCINATRMLHMVEEDCAKIQRFDASPWGKRLVGAYRWHER